MRNIENMERPSWGVFFLVVLMGAYGMYIIGKKQNIVDLPKQAYFLTQKSGPDLNGDGIPDLIIEQANGHKVPMYGVREGENIRYVTVGEYRRLSQHEMDYESIEARLNEE